VRNLQAIFCLQRISCNRVFTRFSDLLIRQFSVNRGVRARTNGCTRKHSASIGLVLARIGAVPALSGVEAVAKNVPQQSLRRLQDADLVLRMDYEGRRKAKLAVGQWVDFYRNALANNERCAS
jgi:hypothetical protein